MKRLNKEYKLNITDNLNLVIGTTNRTEPIVIYLSCKTWLLPLEDNYKISIENIFFNLKKDLKNNLFNSNYFDKRIITDFNYNVNLIEKNKYNFISFDIFLKQKNKIFNLKNLKNILENELNNIFHQLEKNFSDKNIIINKKKNIIFQ